MLELRREGAEQQRGMGRPSMLLNALSAWQREKGGEAAHVARALRTCANRVAAGARDAGTTTDKWGATTRGLMGSGWVREGEVARHDIDTRAHQHHAERHEFKMDSKKLKQIQIYPKL
jgi:hypothetical protein